MGDKVEASSTQRPQTIGEYLEELCAYALSIGMSYEDYWDKDPYLLKTFIRAERIRQKKRNNELWLQGAYIYNAIGSLSPVLNALSKDHKPQPYLKEPYPIDEEEAEERRNKRALAFKKKLIAKTKQKTEGN